MARQTGPNRSGPNNTRRQGRCGRPCTDRFWHENGCAAQNEEDVMKELRGLIAELSATWLKRRKTQALHVVRSNAPATKAPAPKAPANAGKAALRAEPAVRQRPAHKPRPVSRRDLASNM
jgi:hypothetical protein